MVGLGGLEIRPFLQRNPEAQLVACAHSKRSWRKRATHAERYYSLDELRKVKSSTLSALLAAGNAATITSHDASTHGQHRSPKNLFPTHEHAARMVASRKKKCPFGTISPPVSRPAPFESSNTRLAVRLFSTCSVDNNPTKVAVVPYPARPHSLMGCLFAAHCARPCSCIKGRAPIGAICR